MLLSAAAGLRIETTVHRILRGGTSSVSLSAALKAELDIFVLCLLFFGKILVPIQAAMKQLSSMIRQLGRHYYISSFISDVPKKFKLSESITSCFRWLLLTFSSTQI